MINSMLQCTAGIGLSSSSLLSPNHRWKVKAALAHTVAAIGRGGKDGAPQRGGQFGEAAQGCVHRRWRRRFHAEKLAIVRIIGILFFHHSHQIQIEQRRPAHGTVARGGHAVLLLLGESAGITAMAVVQQQVLDALEAKEMPARVAGRGAAADQGETGAAGAGAGNFCYGLRIRILLVRDGTTLFTTTAIIRSSSSFWLGLLLLLLLFTALGPRAKANGTAVMVVIDHRWFGRSERRRPPRILYRMHAEPRRAFLARIMPFHHCCCSSCRRKPLFCGDCARRGDA